MVTPFSETERAGQEIDLKGKSSLGYVVFETFEWKC